MECVIVLTGEEEVRVRKGVILGTGKKKKGERSWGVEKKVGFRREGMGTGRKNK